MGDYKIKYPSLHNQFYAKGIELLDIIDNGEFIQQIQEFRDYLSSGNFRLIPGYLAHKDRDPKNLRDIHNLYSPIVMGLCKIEHPSLDDEIRAEGFELLDVIDNKEFIQRIEEFFNYLLLGNFRFIPGDLAHKDRYPKDSENTHYFYTGGNLEIIEKRELEQEDSRVLELVG